MSGLTGGGALDTIARSLASGISRREALRAGGAALVGAVAASPANALAAVGLTCPTGRVRCNGKCCPRGETCVGTGTNKHCVCPHPRTVCNGACVNLATNHQNCGRCGHACLSNQACCAGKCVNLHTNVNNCGKCGHICHKGAFVATVGCTAGTCKIVACDANWADCNGIYSDGCETLTTTTSDCGGCGIVCQGTNTTQFSCTNGVCTNTCAQGYGDCDSDPTNGCESQLNTTTNCGACGNPCSPANSTGTCASGTCQIVTCNQGYADCNMNPADGCETHTASDAFNCGGCGIQCAATKVCTNSACTCRSGETLCSGICVDTSSDHNNCGACGNVCPVGQVCSSGTCLSGSCPSPYRNCGGSCVDFNSDPHNCGGCGNQCGSNETCVNGVCRSM